jgi:hypothetical protein
MKPARLLEMGESTVVCVNGAGLVTMYRGTSDAPGEQAELRHLLSCRRRALCSRDTWIADSAEELMLAALAEGGRRGKELRAEVEENKR